MHQKDAFQFLPLEFPLPRDNSSDHDGYVCELRPSKPGHLQSYSKFIMCVFFVRLLVRHKRVTVENKITPDPVHTV